MFPVAIIGFAFCFPGDQNDEHTFWNALKERKDFVGHVPTDRWPTVELQHHKRSEPGRSITFSAGVLSRIDEFDAAFFNISPREAAWLDPQQRLLLELAWEAIENAGLPGASIRGTHCAVYVGISSFDYGIRGQDDLASLTPHFMTGNTLSIAANRLSYVFDLRGPSLSIDTACSSSLVALHYACSSLHSGEASTALVGGVNLLAHPYPFVGFTKASMLSASGRCKPFDATADGYVRSEGGAVLLIKPLATALADGDAIQAVILATGVNADGSDKAGITIPSSAGQARLMREVLAKSGVAAHDIDYIEAHGTGTMVGDPVEAAAIGQVYGQGRKHPLPIGSVKANLGHLESASGMAGLIKSILVLKNRAIPPALHLHTPNPEIDFQGLNIEVVTAHRALTRNDGKPLVSGVNSFGFGGSNAHVLLQEFSRANPEYLAPPEKLPPLFLSARTEGALRALAGRYAEVLEHATARDYYDIAYTAAYCRERMDKRLALHPDAAAGMADLLGQYARGAAPAQVVVEDSLLPPGKVAFVYSGNGSQWLGMGRALMAESTHFAEILASIDDLVQQFADFSLIRELQADEADARLDDTVIAQPVIFAIQVAVTALLREQGLQPHAVAGHSVGEVAAAWAAGALELEQAVRVIRTRSQAQGLTRGCGRMAAVGLSAAEARAVLMELGHDPEVEIAGINSCKNVTLSGCLEGLKRVQEQVKPQGVFFRLLDLDYAFHSRRMEPIHGAIASGLADLSPSVTRKTMFVSTVTGKVLEGHGLNADYWWRNVRQPVRFAEAMATLCTLGCRVFVEIGPHAILQRYIGECLTAENVKGRVIPTLRKNADGAGPILAAALRAHLLVDPPSLDHSFPWPGQRVRLPNYPWQRERYWHPRTSEGLLSAERRRVHPLLGWRLIEAEMSWENILDPLVLPWLADHKVGGVILFPGAAYAEMALAAAREWRGDAHLVVEQLDIVSPLVFEQEHARTLRFILNPQDGGFQIKSRQRLSADDWKVHAAGRLLQSAHRFPVCRIETPTKSVRHVDSATHYRSTTALGLDYGASFQVFSAARVGKHQLEVLVALQDTHAADGYLIHPALLDGCFQSIIHFFPEALDTGRAPVFLPVKFDRIDFRTQGKVTHVRADLRHHRARSALADFELLDAAGELIARVAGCRFRAAAFKPDHRLPLANWRIIPRLQPHPAEGTTTALPPVVDLIRQMEGALAHLGASRETWFKQTLPLIEAVTLSFAYQAFQQLARENPEGWQQHLDTPYGRWLIGLLANEQLLIDEAGRLKIVEGAALPSAEKLWQALLQDAPACLPQLMLAGRVGLHLPSLLKGQTESHRFLHALHHSCATEALYTHDPAYLGSHLAIQGALGHVADNWPKSRRLRVLELSAGLSASPQTLLAPLPADRCDYVVALPSEDMCERQRSASQQHPECIVATLEGDGQLVTDRPLPDAFDVVIIRHLLHRAGHPRATLAQARRWLAAGGVLFLAERYPDWSADFLGGLSPSWWYAPNSIGDARAHSSLLTPEGWRQALMDEGFEDCELFLEPAAEGLPEGAYVLLAKRPAEPASPLLPPKGASWLLLADQAAMPLADQLRQRLEANGQRVMVVGRRHQSDAACADHVVSLLGWDDLPDTAAGTLAVLLQDIQRIGTRAQKVPRFWLITRGGALAAELPAGYEPNPAQSALWGFGRVVMNEHPALRCTLIDLACDPAAADTAVRLENELLRPDGTANEIVLGPAARYCLVLGEETKAHPTAAKQDSRYRLDFSVPGQLRNLAWLPDTARLLDEEEVEVRVQTTGLNFRDVMYLMGLLPDEAVENGFSGANLGLEFSGVITRVGKRVHTLKPGDAVLGFGASCFASHVVTRSDAVAPMPQGWTFEMAATVPSVFFTVYYALKHLADLQPGERLLIHGAAGGIGIASIHLARHIGAEIYATAGSDEKRDLVRLLGAHHVFDSRSLSFAEEIRSITNGEGVDVVLNSLAGEAMRRSLDALKPFGRFLELGKRDFYENTPVGLRFFKNNISYFGIDTDQLLINRPKLASRLFHEVMALFHQGALSPLPYRSFPPDRIVDAFRVMQQSRHIGKIVVSLAGDQPSINQADRPKAAFRPKGTWLVTGGLTGFGLESARWLAARGVDHMVLVGRRGVATPGADEIIEEFTSLGVKVLIRSCDISDPEAIGALIASIKTIMPPLKGVVHAAAIFDDRLLAHLDGQSLQAVLAPKLAGARHLHQATLAIPLDHFILYSSVTTAIGNPGQANYVAANAGLEGLAALRRRMGLPATCIAWGPIDDAGYLVRNAAAKRNLEQRLGRPAMSAQEALAHLDEAIIAEAGVRTVANFDWPSLARQLPSTAGTRFRLLNQSGEKQRQSGNAFDFAALLAEKTPEQAAGIVGNLVVEDVAQILCIKADRIDPNRPLHDFGMDSLMAVELAAILEQRFGVSLPVMLLSTTASIDRITTSIIEKLTQLDRYAAEPQLESFIEGIARQHGAPMTPAEIGRLADQTRMLAQNAAPR